MKIEKKLWITLFLSGIFAVCFSCWIFSMSTGREKMPFNNTLELKTEESVDEGVKIETAVLPEEFNIPRSILFKTTHTKVEIWLDENQIYQYGNEENAPAFLKSTGTYWHVVDIPGNCGGKTLEIRIIPVYSGYYGNSVDVVFGSKGDCVLKRLGDCLGTLIISCGILFAGIVSLILYFAAVRSKKNGNGEIFLNLGIFSLLIALWSMRQCGFLQFLISDGRTLYFVDLFTFFLFPVPFNFLLYDICKSKYRKGTLYLPVLYLLNMAVAVFLQCTGVIDIFQLLPAVHVLMLINVVYTFVLIRYEAKNEKNESARYFKYPMYIIMCFGMMEMLLYYVRKFQNTSVFLPLGNMIFIIMLIWIQVSRYYDLYIQQQKILYLQKMANMDMLTEAMNRNAYEDMVKYLDEQEIELRTTGVVLFDLDNLKVINDNFGHAKGDEALKLCYQCIRQTFLQEKNCFRIGGDEFAYVYHSDEKGQIADKLKTLDRLLKDTARNLSYPLSVSAGYAYYTPDTDIDFKDIVRRSDTMLYRQKRRKKMLRTNVPDDARPYMEKHQAEMITDEVIFREKKFQNITPEELCSVIDLLSPSTDDYPYFIDFRTDFYYIAPQALERFCIPKNEFHDVMEQHKEFVYGPDYQLLKGEFKDLLSTERCTHNLEYRWLDLKRKPVWINCRGYVVRDDELKPLYMMGCINEIGEKQKADNVSGFLGEGALREYLKTLDGVLEKGCFLRLGLDHFKEINENFGWEYGDFVLRETAACISSCLSENQKVYKMASDEFLILDTVSDRVKEARELYDQVREAIDRFIEENKFAVMFTVSGGILPLHDLEEKGYSEAMKRSDFSLNEAKKLGRNRCYIFQEEKYLRFLRKRELTQELREAVRKGFRGFEAFYQPVFKADDGSLYGAEALMRFTSEKFNMVSPAEFIPILEESGLIIPAGRWMMREAMGKCSEIRKRIPEFQVSINVSQVQAAKSDVILDVAAEMKRAGIGADALIIELTESDLLEENINEKHFLTELKRMGIKLALDDFGTGYSNFHYLSELNPAIIKIDRSFTASAVADEGEYYLLNQFCSMIHNLHLKLCIEGVENEEEWAKISRLKPDFSQGFMWGKPCRYEDFVQQFVKEESEVVRFY